MNWIAATLISLGLLHSPAAVEATPTAAVCINTCITSERGYDLIRTFEGYMPFPYKDIAGIQTVGYGYVIKPEDKFVYPLLPPDADKLLRKTVNDFEPEINQAVIVELKQNQFDSLVSFTYNVGSQSLRESTLLKRINERRNKEIPNCFLMWNKARVDGVLQSVKGLVLRR